MIKAKSIPEYARWKGVSVQTIYNWIKEGKLQTVTVLGKKLIKI